MDLLHKRISPTRIKTVLTEITPKDYMDTVLTLAERNWEYIRKKHFEKSREMLGIYPRTWVCDQLGLRQSKGAGK